MVNEDIKAMFQANIALKHCQPNDPQKPMLEEAVKQLTKQYVTECVVKPTSIEQDSKIDLQEAFDILVNACQSATSLEFEHHPGGMNDEQIETIALARKTALDKIVEEIRLKN